MKRCLPSRAQKYVFKPDLVLHTAQNVLISREPLVAQNGNINLYTVRLDEGRVRHTWTPQPDTEEAHQPKAISALTFAQGQTSFVSGGADAKVMVSELVPLFFGQP